MRGEVIFNNPYNQPFNSKLSNNQNTELLEHHCDSNSIDSGMFGSDNYEVSQTMKPKKRQPELSKLILQRPVLDQSPFPDGDRYIMSGMNWENGDFLATPPTGLKHDFSWDSNSPLTMSSAVFGNVSKASIPQTSFRRDSKLLETKAATCVESTTGLASGDISEFQKLSSLTTTNTARSMELETHVKSESRVHDHEVEEVQSDMPASEPSIDSSSPSADHPRKRKRDNDDDDSLIEAESKTKRRKKRSRAYGHNKGSWTDDEHRLFLEGLEKFGRSKWREISEYVGTRSRIQVASHSQKYFAKSDQGKGAHPKMRTRKYDS